MFSVNIYSFTSFLIFYDHESRIFDYLFGSFPFEVFEKHTPRRKICCVLVELSAVSGKIFIYPFLTRISSQPLKDCCLLLEVISHWIIHILFLFKSFVLSFLMGRIFDLQLRIWRGNISFVIIHEIFFIVIVFTIKDVLLSSQVGFRHGTLFWIVLHKVSKYYDY